MHFSRLIRIGCVSGLAASPILAQNLPVSVEHGNAELHESARNAGAPMSVREQLVARITALRAEGNLTEKQAEHFRREVENQIAQAEKSRDSLRLVSVAGELETKIDAAAGAAQALQIQTRSELATSKGFEAIRQFEAKVAIARSRREAQLTAEAVLAEGARRERQAQKMKEFAAIQSARLDALNQKATVPAAVEVTSKTDSQSQIAVIPAKQVEALHAEPSGPEKVSPPVVVETPAVKEPSEVPAERSHAAGPAPTSDQIEKLHAAALEVLHAPQTGATKPSTTLVAANTLASPSSQPETTQPPVTTTASSAEQIEKLQAAALEVLHAQQAETTKAPATLVAQNTTNPGSQAAAPQAPAAASAPSAEQIEKLQAAALEALHSQPAPVAVPPPKKAGEKKSNKVRTTPEAAISSKFAKPAEAPADAHERAVQEAREKMQKPVTAPNLNEAQIAKSQERALEVLHESTPAVVSTVAKEETEKELQQRAREIVRQQKADAEQARIAAKNADAPISSKTPSDSTTTAQVDPAVLERARAILREHQASEKTNSSVSAPATQPAPQSQTVLPKLNSHADAPVEKTPVPAAAVVSDVQPFRTSLPPASDEALERARAELRQQKPAIAASTQAPAPAVLSSSVPAESPGSGLNEKTRQLLIRQNKELEKSAGKTATPAPATDSGKIDPYARAREVLRNQPNSTKDAPVSPSIAAPSTSAPASPAIVAAPPANTVPQTAPAALPSTVVPAAQPSASSVTDRNDAVLERAREILRQQKASSQTETGSSAPATVTPVPAVPAASQPAPEPRAAAPAGVDIDVVHARALEALHAQEEAEKKPTPPVANKPVPPAQKPAPIVKPETVMKPAPPAQPTPTVQAAPTAKTKKEKLADLLELYKADKITPSQYQEERAKIIAEP